MGRLIRAIRETSHFFVFSPFFLPVRKVFIFVFLR